MQKDGVNCSKGYPKPFSEVTILTPGQFPMYKRPNNGRFVMKGRFKMTNQHGKIFPIKYQKYSFKN